MKISAMKISARAISARAEIVLGRDCPRVDPDRAAAGPSLDITIGDRLEIALAALDPLVR